MDVLGSKNRAEKSYFWSILLGNFSGSVFYLVALVGQNFFFVFSIQRA